MPITSSSSCSAARAASGRAASSSSSSARTIITAIASTRPPRQPRQSSAPSAQLTCQWRRLSVALLPLPLLQSSQPLPAPQRRFLPLRSFNADRDDVCVELKGEENESWSVANLNAASSASATAGAAMLGFLLSALAASADEAAVVPSEIPYDPSAGSDFLRNVAGAAYVVLLVIFAFRLLRRRADFATSTRIARGSRGNAAPNADARGLTPEQRRQNFIAEGASDSARRRRKPIRATPLRAAVGALQAGTCAFLLWQVCTRVDAFFETFELPDGYTAHNIAVTLRTVGRGLSYLLTFLFAANAVGLGGLAVQLVFYPEPEPVEEEEEEEGEGEGEEGDERTLSTTATASPSSGSGNDADEEDAAALRPLSSALSSEDETGTK